MTKILIDDREDICTVCSKDFKHIVGYKLTDSYQVYEIGFFTTCGLCTKLLTKKRKLEAQLLDTEFEIYCLSNKK
jgi:hypothetical protein